MRSRWGEQRIVRLDVLDPTTRQIILAILAAREAAAVRPPGGKGSGGPPCDQPGRLTSIIPHRPGGAKPP